MNEENQDFSSLLPPPSYDECVSNQPPRQTNDPALSGYPGTRPTGHAVSPGYTGSQSTCLAGTPGYTVTKSTCPAGTPGYTGTQSMGFLVQPGFQPGFEPGFQHPPGLQQGAPPFFHQGQPRYPTQHPQPNRPYTQGSYSGQQPQPHPNRPYPEGSYPTRQPNLNRPYPQGSYNGQQTSEQLLPGQSYTTTQVVATQPDQPDQQTGDGVTNTRPPDYLCPAVLACCCCFCPTGSVAICLAHKANTMAMAGNMDGANMWAAAAGDLIIASVVIGILIIIIGSIAYNH